MKTLLKMVILLSGIIALGACTTTQLLKQDSRYTRQIPKTLIHDNVVAFGMPIQALHNIPSDAIVMVGDKQSYVLMEGGGRLLALLNRLDPHYLRVTSPLKFVSKQNDGRFEGTLKLRYSHLKDDVTKNDIQFFLQNNVRECTSDSDKNMNVQSFCFDIDLQGAIYPPVNNRNHLKKLSKSYPIEIYTHITETYYKDSVVAQKVVLFPFAVAVDVMTLPLQALHLIFEK